MFRHLISWSADTGHWPCLPFKMQLSCCIVHLPVSEMTCKWVWNTAVNPSLHRYSEHLGVSAPRNHNRLLTTVSGFDLVKSTFMNQISFGLMFQKAESLTFVFLTLFQLNRLPALTAWKSNAKSANWVCLHLPSSPFSHSGPLSRALVEMNPDD